MENPDKRPLPPGWITQYDSRYSAWYYVNTSASPPVTVWEHPLGAPPPAPPLRTTPHPPDPRLPTITPTPARAPHHIPALVPAPAHPRITTTRPIATTATLKGSMGDTQAGEAQVAIPVNSPATVHPHSPSMEGTAPRLPLAAGAHINSLLLSRIGSKRRRLSKEGKARRLFGGLFGKKPSSGYGGGGYGQQPQVVYAQQPAKSGGGMGMGGMLAAGGAGLIGGALIANAIDDSQEDAYREGYEDAQDGGGFDDDF
ncbi:hypothetical protein EYR38_005152 [Pleurotus pulmonarius]|nr:hypothetical protein EYR38_005152 [Pleurotus pulmonarius]